jgi:hypothetical protein
MGRHRPAGDKTEENEVHAKTRKKKNDEKCVREEEIMCVF